MNFMKLHRAVRELLHANGHADILQLLVAYKWILKKLGVRM
jgi:hypothetical protein